MSRVTTFAAVVTAVVAATAGYRVGMASAPKFPWEAEVIPSAAAVLDSTFLGYFASAAACRAAATQALTAFRSRDGAFLCGRDCTGDAESAQGKVCVERLAGRASPQI